MDNGHIARRIRQEALRLFLVHQIEVGQVIERLLHRVTVLEDGFDHVGIEILLLRVLHDRDLGRKGGSIEEKALITEAAFGRIPLGAPKNVTHITLGTGFKLQKCIVSGFVILVVSNKELGSIRRLEDGAGACRPSFEVLCRACRKKNRNVTKEEWLGHLEEVAGETSNLVLAIGFQIAALRIESELLKVKGAEVPDAPRTAGKLQNLTLGLLPEKKLDWRKFAVSYGFVVCWLLILVIKRYF
jgi:hypothetical protein